MTTATAVVDDNNDNDHTTHPTMPAAMFLHVQCPDEILHTTAAAAERAVPAVTVTSDRHRRSAGGSRPGTVPAHQTLHFCLQGLG